MTHVRSMRDLFEEHQAFTLAGQALPTPTDTPYTRSRRSSRHGTPTPSNPSSSPPPLPPDSGKDNAPTEDDEEFSMLDPRRFTPTLHASLVSEILSLRRELDSKHRFIENLEHNLQDSRSESENLQERLTETSKENRSAKRQLKQVEDGTLAALQELASERDDLKNVQKDLRHKLEVSQKQAKTQEQDAERAYNVHMSEKQGWENEKRGLERRVHASESRLQTFINEVNAQHAAEFGPELGDVSEIEEDARDSGLGNDSDVPSAQSSPSRQRPTRDRSSSSTRRSSTRQSNRFSIDSALGSGRQSRQHGRTLADELVFDEEEEDLDDLEEIEDAYADRETRLRRARESRQSFNQDDKAKRVLGLSNGRESSSDHYDSLEYERRDLIRPIQEVPTPKEEELSPVMPMNSSYVDAGIQYSPPTSPTLPIMVPTSPPTSPEAAPILQEKATPSAEVEANQSRKRIASPVRSPSPKPRKLTSEKPATPLVVLVSSATQTIEEFPVLAPVADAAIQATQPGYETVVQPSYSSISTQTDPPKEEAVNHGKIERMPAPASLAIPLIAIHPPLSGPPSPKEAVLPPATKNAACQVSIEDRVPTTDSGTQTERITIDQRILKLPPHLWPSAIKDKDLRSVETSQGSRERLPIAIGKEDLGSERRPALESFALSKEAQSPLPLTEDHYPGNNDNGPLAKDAVEGPRRPFRSASLFAGFNDEEGGDETDLDEPDSQSKSRIAPKSTSVNRLTRNGFSFSDPPTPVPEEKESPYSDVQKERDETSIPKEDVEARVAENVASGRNSLERAPRVMKPIRMASMVKPPNLRRSSLIANGTTAHLRQGSKTPSERSFGSASMSSTVAPPPPFPVPLRSSSRRVWQTRSEGSYSPTPGQNGMHSGRRPLVDAAKQHPGKDALRKVRSANVIPRHARRGSRPRSRSPPNSFQSSMPSSITSPTLPEHEIPELPRDNIKSPRHVFQLQKSNSRAAQSDVTSRTGSASAGSASQQQSSVVDAIAITMVGEWMWKYVRRRKSFGVPESPAEVSRPGEDGSITVTSNGQRHKRWVWLSPYERSVMWSSKQPSSNSALMGKSGRKLIIQSVLDVKDDTPLPKNAGNIFNRSILILTPARALKFTAFSSERHYLWLTALSFLSHHPSQRLSPLPAIPAPEPKSVKPPSSETPSAEPKIPIPEKELEKPTRATAMLRRTPLRDSVRIAKSRGGISSRGRPEGPARNATAPPTLPEFRESFDVGVEQEIHSATGTTFFDQIHSNPPPAEYRFSDLPSNDHLRPNTAGTTGTAESGAEYPNVPRYHGHGRKRSASGPVAPSPRDLQTVPSSGRLGSLRGWTQWPEKLSSRPMSRDGGGGSSGEPPRFYTDVNDSTTTIAPPPIPITRPRSRTSDQHHAPLPSTIRPQSRPPLPSATSAPPPQLPGQRAPPPSSRSGSRNGMMRMEAFVQPVSQLARAESEPSSAPPVGKTGFGVEAAVLLPERIRTGRRLPGFVPRRRSKVPEAWTKGVVVGGGAGEGGDGGEGLADPFRGF